MKIRSLTAQLIEYPTALLLVIIYFILVRAGLLKCAMAFSRSLKVVALPFVYFHRNRESEAAFESGRRAVTRIARHFPAPVSCLVTVLALQSLLRFRNIESTIEMGINPHGELTEAHAWLSVNGITTDKNVSGYVRFSPV